MQPFESDPAGLATELLTITLDNWDKTPSERLQYDDVIDRLILSPELLQNVVNEITFSLIPSLIAAMESIGMDWKTSITVGIKDGMLNPEVMTSTSSYLGGAPVPADLSTFERPDLCVSAICGTTTILLQDYAERKTGTHGSISLNLGLKYTLDPVATKAALDFVQDWRLSR